MNNLFLNAMDSTEVDTIKKIKKNKAFLKRVIKDLEQVFTIFVSYQDGVNSTKFNIKRSANYNDVIYFSANDKGILFSTSLLGYRQHTERPDRALGWIIEKYETCTAEERFKTGHGHGHVEVKFHFDEDSTNLNDILKDIVRVFNHADVSKRF